MATLDEVSANYKGGVAGATHLLLIGHTKSGKSHYVARAAQAGYEVLYIDNDNGFPTLMEVLKNDPAAKKRVHYFNPANQAEFVESVLTRAIVRYNEDTRGDFVSTGLAVKPETKMVEIIPSLIPRNVIVSIDSWSSLAYSVMKNVAASREKPVDLMDIDKYGREIYGPSNYKLTQLATVLQFAPFHVIVQAHIAYYERKEKPVGKTVTDTKEGEMIIKETLELPQSSSNPHALTLGKHFNQIGYLVIDRWDKRQLDFSVKQNRIGGGTPGKSGNPEEEYSFVNLFGKPATVPTEERAWIRYMTAQQFIDSRKPAAPVLKTSLSSELMATQVQAAALTLSQRLKLGGSKS